MREDGRHISETIVRRRSTEEKEERSLASSQAKNYSNRRTLVTREIAPRCLQCRVKLFHRPHLSPLPPHDRGDINSNPPLCSTGTGCRSWSPFANEMRRLISGQTVYGVCLTVLRRTTDPLLLDVSPRAPAGPVYPRLVNRLSIYLETAVKWPATIFTPLVETPPLFVLVCLSLRMNRIFLSIFLVFSLVSNWSSRSWFSQSSNCYKSRYKFRIR